jgi:hypothetical protein
MVTQHRHHLRHARKKTVVMDSAMQNLAVPVAAKIEEDDMHAAQ